MKNYDFDEEQDKSSVPWNSFNEEIKHVVIDQRISTIGSYAFSNCTLLSSITIPDTVTTIESGAFYKCTSLKTITLPESVTMIGDKAFENCTSMTSLALPENLKTIGSRAFYGCSQMKSLTLPNGELSVGESAFDDFPGIIFFDENYTRKYQEFNKNQRGQDDEEEIETLIGEFLECDRETILFNQSDLLSLGTVYKSEFSITNISTETLNIEFFTKGFSEPHEVVFDPPRVELSEGDSKLITVSIKFRCTANLLPYQVYICGELDHDSHRWGKICGIEAHTDISKFISCDDLELSSKPLGEGSFSKVYLGKYKGEDVAVKEYTSFSGANSIEAQLFAKFSSSYIVRFYGICYSLNALVLEYCPLGSVEQCYYNPEMTEEVKTLICYDFARAIKYFHDNNHIHRDLKPDNLLMCSFSHDINVPRAKLSDFGTGKVSFKQEKNSSVQGTPAFIAPEVLTGTFDKKCDVYSFGMSMWSIFAEKQPYEDEALRNFSSEEDYYNMIRQGIRPKLVSKCPLNELVVKCWDTDPSKRPAFNEITKELLKTIIATQKAQNEINSAKKDAEMAPLLELFDGNKKGANKFLKLFCGSPSDAVTFIKAFKDTKVAEEHMEELNNEWDEMTDNSCGVNCKWMFDEKTGPLFIKGEGAMKNYDFDEEQDESSVPWDSLNKEIKHIVIDQQITTIGNYAFSNCTLLSSITIPDTVTTIWNGAFFKCTSLETITIPESVTMIGENVFRECSSLTSITIPDNVTMIGENVFRECSSLTSIVIPNSVTKIGKYAFSSCSSLTSISIPDSITTIGHYAFSSCSLLTSITIPDSITKIEDDAFHECSSLSSIIIPNSVTTIGKSAFSGCSSLISGTIGAINWKLNKETGEMTFTGGEMTNFNSYPWDGTKDSIKKVTISEGITTIGEDAFSSCSSLTSITIPNSVTIGRDAFYGCSSLTSLTLTGTGEMKIKLKEISYNFVMVVISDGITTIGDKAFSSCSSLKSVTIPNSVTIGRCAFYGCSSLTSLTLTGTGEMKIEPKEISDKLVTVIISDGITTIGEYAFSKCSSLTSITIPNSVTTIGKYAFSSCSSLTSITIPNSVTTIRKGAFYGCSSLTSITIPDSVTTIGIEAFYKCLSLTSITIPTSVKLIGAEAFEECTQLTSGKLGDISWKFKEKKTELLFTGTGRMPEFLEGGAPWSSSCSHVKTIKISEGITSIGDFAFSICGKLKKVSLPSTIESIGFNANIKGTEIPRNVKRPLACGENCFATFSNGVLTIEGSGEMPNFKDEERASWYSIRESIKEVKISEGITSIGKYAFSDCTSLTSVTIPESVTAIGYYAFSKCSSLTSITIPDSVTTIGGSAFYYCCSLTSITIPNNVTVIGECAFYYCRSLPAINVSENNQHFAYVDGILFTKDMKTLICYSAGKKESNFSVPNSVTTIEERAFSYSRSLTFIIIPNSVTTIGNYAFEGCSSLTSGTIGTINWKINKETREMTFTGKGEMMNFEYSSSRPWDESKGLIKRVIISEGITTIGKDAFSSRSSLKSITIPNSVITIGESAFSHCSSLTSITIPNSVTTIEILAFDSCSSLSSITIPNSVTTIGFGALWSCSSLTTATLPKRFESQKDSIFGQYCKKLTTINWTE